MTGKSVISVSEMAAKCHFSRSRFYDLVAAGVFPAPVVHPSGKRPMYVRELQERCLEVCSTGIGINGQPVLFNRKPVRGKPPVKPRAKGGEVTDEVVIMLKRLGLNTTPQAVEDAFAELYPQGIAGVEMSALITNTHNHLKGKAT